MWLNLYNTQDVVIAPCRTAPIRAQPQDVEVVNPLPRIYNLFVPKVLCLKMSLSNKGSRNQGNRIFQQNVFTRKFYF